MNSDDNKYLFGAFLAAVIAIVIVLIYTAGVDYAIQKTIETCDRYSEIDFNDIAYICHKKSNGNL